MKSLIQECKQLSPNLQKVLLGAALVVVAVGVLVGVIIGNAASAFIPASGQELDTVLLDDDESFGAQDVYAVEVLGQVASPGVYELTQPLRVIELIDLVGGLGQQADLEYIHKEVALSVFVEDGYKLYVPAVGVSSSSGVETGLVSLNNASSEQLQTLPGVGQATASKIIAARPYSAVDDLLEVEGIGEQTLEKLRELISL